MRRVLFDQAMAEIKLHNQDLSNTWKKGVNQFTDMTSEEFQQMAGYRRVTGDNLHRRDPPDVPLLEEDELPEAVDWSAVPGIMSAIKDQGRCGSCWAFAASAAIESYLAMATGELYSLSPQYLVSCAPNPLNCGGRGGCSGSTAQIAYQLAITGIPSIWTYPYNSYEGNSGACSQLNGNQPPIRMNFTGYVNLPRNEYLPLLNAVATIGPIVVSVASSDWHHYETGVYSSSYTTIDHIVLLVGYGTTDDGVDYWKVRNSWSPSWGENGYIRIARSTTCGLDYAAQEGSGCDGDPTTETVCGVGGILFDSSYPLIYPFD